METEIEHDLPPHVNVQNILQTLKHKVQKTDNQLQENEALNCLISDLNCAEQFMRHLWNKIKQSFCETITSVEVVSNKIVNDFYRKYQEFVTSEA